MAVIDKINRKGVSGKRILTGPGELVGPTTSKAVFSSVTGITGSVDFYEITDGTGANEGTYTITLRPYSEAGFRASINGVGSVALVQQLDGVNTPSATATCVARKKPASGTSSVVLGPVSVATTDRLFVVVQRRDSSTLRYQLEVDQVLDAITISAQPPNRSIATGNPTTFTITATTNDGGTLSYQWQISTDGGTTFTNVSNGGVYTTATTATLNISNVAGLNGNRYRCRVSSNGGAPTVNSTAGVLTVT